MKTTPKRGLYQVSIDVGKLLGELEILKIRGELPPEDPVEVISHRARANPHVSSL